MCNKNTLEKAAKPMQSSLSSETIVAGTQLRLAKVRERTPADVSLASLLELIQKFERSLNAHEEIGTYLAAFGSKVMVHLDSIRCNGPQLLALDGRLQGGERVRLVQHHSQMNVLLVATEVEVGREPRRLGFFLQQAGGPNIAGVRPSPEPLTEGAAD